MTEQQIKRAKRLAEILGIEIGESVMRLGDKAVSTGRGLIYSKSFREFNPEQDKELLWELFSKNSIDVTHFNDGSGIYFTADVDSGFDSIDELPAALIDCVIEINGGYHD